MKIGLVDVSDTGISGSDLRRIADALEMQSWRDYSALWQTSGIDHRVYDRLDQLPADTSPLVIYKDADQPDALGYHELLADGRPGGRIFVAPIVANEGTVLSGSISISVTCSHESLEMSHNPYIGLWHDGPNGVEYAAEVGDPVEGDSYDVDGVSVSNFVGPRWFRQGPGPYDQMGNLVAPFTMTAGGYIIQRTSGVDVHEVYGELFPEWKKVVKHAGRLGTMIKVV